VTSLVMFLNKRLVLTEILKASTTKAIDPFRPGFVMKSLLAE
jgi:hypothetical protein